MGKFKDVGHPSLALAEECSEVIQIIAKMHRFGGNWNDVPPGKNESRWQELCNEMADLFYQWERLKMDYDSCHDQPEPSDESYKSLQ